MSEDKDYNEYKFTGALIDQRSDDAKKKDWCHEEAFASTPVVWKEGLPTQWNFTPKFEQWYTGQCVAQSTTKALGILNQIETGTFYHGSPTDFYDHRANKPGAGMNWDDAMQIAIKYGACKNERIPQPIHESDVPTSITRNDEMIKEAFDKAGQSYFTLQDRSIDSIASVIEQRGYCLVWFWFDEAGREWWKQQPSILYPELTTYGVGSTRHALIAIKYFLIDGKKYILVDDSAGNSSSINGQYRLISEDFMKRCFVAGYVIDKKNLDYTVPNKPKYKFTKTLKFGMIDKDVKALQDILVYEGILKLKTTTNNFLGLTLSAVKAFQEKHANEILKPVGLTKGTGLVGNSTIAYLNKYYS